MVADNANANPGDQTDAQETRATSSSPQRCPCQADCAPPEKNGVTETGCSAETWQECPQTHRVSLSCALCRILSCPAVWLFSAESCTDLKWPGQYQQRGSNLQDKQAYGPLSPHHTHHLTAVSPRDLLSITCLPIIISCKGEKELLS